MDKYRLRRPRKVRVPVPPEIYVGNAMEEEYRGEIAPYIDPEAAEQGYVAEERYLILELGFISLGLGWKKIKNNKTTRLPRDYEVIIPTTQLINPDSTLAEGTKVEDEHHWAKDGYPDLYSWRRIRQVAALEAVFQASTGSGNSIEDQARLVEEPVIQKTRYIKFGGKVRQFSGKIKEAPAVV